MLAEEGVERIDGPHCYAFFSGNEAFAAKADDDCTAFFLTEYLPKHFDQLIRAAEHCAHDRFGIDHSTIQVERTADGADHDCADSHGHSHGCGHS